MQYRKFGKLDVNVSLLGFGAMRFPEKDGKVDVDYAVKMLRYAVDNGVNYIDTAYVYHGGDSERIVGAALKDGYRDKVMVATKSPSWSVKTADDWVRMLDEQREKLGVECIDFYLQHGLNKDTWHNMESVGMWELAEKAKESGKIKYFGFSFHDDYNCFEEIINAHDWDFCQIQFNYLDTNHQAGLAGLRLAGKKNIGVIVMEPLRGGKLAANLPDDISALFENHPSGRTPADMALRFVADFPEVSVILSGMSNMEQVEQNIRCCSSDDYAPNSMTDDGKKFIEQVESTFRNKVSVGCTKCAYCMPCPGGVDIPACFDAINTFYFSTWFPEKTAKEKYAKLAEEGKSAANCVECGACEGVCPQQINIIERLKDVHCQLSTQKT